MENQDLIQTLWISISQDWVSNSSNLFNQNNITEFISVFLITLRDQRKFKLVRSQNQTKDESFKLYKKNKIDEVNSLQRPSDVFASVIRRTTKSLLPVRFEPRSSESVALRLTT